MKSIPLKLILLVSAIQILFTNKALSDSCIGNDSITIDFQGSYNNDSIIVYSGDNVVFSGVIDTDTLTGLAGSFTIKKPESEYYPVRI